MLVRPLFVGLSMCFNGFIHLIGGAGQTAGSICEEGKEDIEKDVTGYESSSVFPSLPLAIRWLRDNVQQNQSVRFQVLLAFLSKKLTAIDLLGFVN